MHGVKMAPARIIEDISRFADLDSSIESEVVGDDILLSFAQQGERVKLRLSQDGGRVLEDRQGASNRYSTFRGLLMSSKFGNLQRLVDASAALMKREAPYIFDPSNHLPIVGVFESEEGNSQRDLLRACDEWLLSSSKGGAIRTLVVDGPAGIGKTHLIRRLVVERAKVFGPGSPPPILHVQSRGKKLSTLDDVIAGTLNALRLAITNEQVPVLVRNGLLHLAIDGFDELADPAGYETAWGSVIELVEEIEGCGALILAGRDTFLDVVSVKNSVARLNTNATTSVHLRPLKRNEAVTWLASKIGQERLEELDEVGLLDDGSYALRPLFIHELSRLEDDTFDRDRFLTFPLASLVSSILLREAKLVEAALRSDVHNVNGLIEEFLKEVARFMADAESDSIDLSSLDLIAQLVFTSRVRDDELAMIRHRVNAFALLESDGSATRRRFSHSEIQDYFLAKSYLDVIASDSLPKSVRRNILGADFLETFHDVASVVDESVISEWGARACNVIRTERYPDRTVLNLAAMVLALLGTRARQLGMSRLENLSLDEICFRGSLSSFELAYVNISHLDARGADMSEIIFSDCSITSLLADDSTRLPDSFPERFNLHLEVNNRTKAIYDATEINVWRQEHNNQRSIYEVESSQLKLLDRVCRVVMRRHWIRGIEEDRAGRLLQDPLWDEVSEALKQRQLLKIREGVAVGGPRSRFFRIEKAFEFLNPNTQDEDVLWVRNKLSS